MGKGQYQISYEFHYKMQFESQMKKVFLCFSTSIITQMHLDLLVQVLRQFVFLTTQLSTFLIKILSHQVLTLSQMMLKSSFLNLILQIFHTLLLFSLIRTWNSNSQNLLTGKIELNKVQSLCLPALQIRSSILRITRRRESKITLVLLQNQRMMWN